MYPLRSKHTLTPFIDSTDCNLIKMTDTTAHTLPVCAHSTVNGPGMFVLHVLSNAHTHIQHKPINIPNKIIPADDQHIYFYYFFFRFK